MVSLKEFEKIYDNLNDRGKIEVLSYASECPYLTYLKTRFREDDLKLYPGNDTRVISKYSLFKNFFDDSVKIVNGGPQDDYQQFYSYILYTLDHGIDKNIAGKLKNLFLNSRVYNKSDIYNYIMQIYHILKNYNVSELTDTIYDLKLFSQLVSYKLKAYDLFSTFSQIDIDKGKDKIFDTSYQSFSYLFKKIYALATSENLGYVKIHNLSIYLSLFASLLSLNEMESEHLMHFIIYVFMVPRDVSIDYISMLESSFISKVKEKMYNLIIDLLDENESPLKYNYSINPEILDISIYEKSHYLFCFRDKDDNQISTIKEIMNNIDDDTVFDIDKTLKSISKYKDPDTNEVFSENDITFDLSGDDCAVVINLISNYDKENTASIFLFGNMLNSFSGDHKFILLKTLTNKIYILFKFFDNPNVIYALNTCDKHDDRELIKFDKPKNITFEIKSNI